MSETTKETLVREVIHATPDGTGTKRMEQVEVEIIWPKGRPSSLESYREFGSWHVTERRPHDRRERGELPIDGEAAKAIWWVAENWSKDDA